MPFRSLMKELGCGLITTELVSVRALETSNLRTRQLIAYENIQRPIGIQIFGEDPESISKGAKKAEDCGVDFLDLNLGCPVTKIVKKGAGSALLKDLNQLQKVLRAMKSSVSIPVSLKVRTGWNASSLNADEVAHIAFNEGFSWMTIHGRTREQGYSGKADWNYIKKVKSKSSIPIIGNGDLISADQVIHHFKESGCDGVMIGRGCLYKPWIFQESLNQLNHQKPSQKRSIMEVIYLLRNKLNVFYDERVSSLQLKKFCAWYSSGYPHSTEFRKNLFKEKNPEILMEFIESFFTKNSSFASSEIEKSLLLQRGHG